MENQNQTPVETPTPQTPATPTAATTSKKSWAKRLLVWVLVFAAIGLGYVGVTNPELFRAAITEVQLTPEQQDCNCLLIPSYTANAVDEGKIDVKLLIDNQTPPTDEDVHSLKFKLKWEPVSALTLGPNSINFEDTIFEGAELKSVNTDRDGEAIISFFSSDPAQLLIGEDGMSVVKLITQVNGTPGSTIDMSVEDVEVIVANTGTDAATNPFVFSNQYTQIEAGTIALTTKEDLRVLYAEAIDSTHLRVHFSDFITEPGSPNDYQFEQNYTVESVQLASDTIFDDISEPGKAVVLTMAGNFPPSTAEVLTILDAAPVKGNVQGGLADEYRFARFVTPGTFGGTFSNFSVVSADATDYKTLRLGFSQQIEPASVNPVAFTLTPPNQVLSAQAVSGNEIEITLQNALAKRQTAIVEIENNPNSNFAVRSAGGSDVLGINKAAVGGFKDGPRINNTSFTDETTLVINFDENVTSTINGGPGGFGNIVETGSNTILFTADNSNTTISGSSITISGFTNDPNTNYTFIEAGNLGNSDSVSIDSNFNRISFFGAPTDTSEPNQTVGLARPTRQDVIEVDPGDVNFDLLGLNDVAIHDYENNGSFALGALTQLNEVSTTGDGKLRLVTESRLQPNKTYVVQIGNPTLATARFSFGRDVSVIGAQAVDTNKVMVSFSDNIDQATVNSQYFNIPGFTVVEATVQPDFKQVLLRTSTDFQNIEVYEVNIETIDPSSTTQGVRSFFGAQSLSPSSTVFTGLGTAVGLSSTRIESLANASNTEVTVNFSSAVDAESVTPVNFKVEQIAPGQADPNSPTVSELTVQSVDVIDATTVRLTTSQQGPDVNYFVRTTGVTADGLLLNNSRVLNVFGPGVTDVNVFNISATSLENNVDQNIILTGTGLDTVIQASLGTTNLVIAEQTAGALTVIVPQGLDPDVYDLVLITSAGNTLEFDAVINVVVPQLPFQINTAQSQSVPDRVAPDGESEVVIWVLVEDPLDFASVDTVLINLQPIGGNPAQPMAAGPISELGQFYNYTTTVSAVTPTSETPIDLTVEARKGTEVVTGTVALTVTNDILASVAPVFDQAYISPTTISPDGLTPVTISAKISDPDGAATINTVIADLSEIGLGFEPLNRLDVSGEANELVTGFFTSDEFTVPETAEVGDFVITLTATDATGEESTADIAVTVSQELTQPTIDFARSYLAPRNSVPRDGQTPFTIHAMVTDPNGLADVDTVIAYMPTLGVAPVALIRDPAASESGKTALYSSGAVVVPNTASFGGHQVEVIATDQNGGTGSVIIPMEVAAIDVLGDAPRVFDNKAYTTPKIAVNDGETAMTLYTFVRDDDNDLASVVVNLSNIGQVGPETPPDFSAVNTGAETATPGSGLGGCPTGSNTIVCMTPSFTEGADGQWFVLSGVTISKNTQPSTQPYAVEVIATDATGKTGRGEILVTVSSEAGFAQDAQPPRMITAVPTEANTLEVVFSESMSAVGLSPSGSQFNITNRNDVTDTLAVIGATINASGNIITLTTAEMEPGKQYVLNGSSDLTDITGINLVTGSASRANFSGFDDSTKEPVVHFVSATDVDTLEIEFQENLRPTSLKLGDQGGDFDIAVFQADATNTPLAVKGVRMLAGNVLEVTTDTMKSGQRYRVEIVDLASAGGFELSRKEAKFLKSINAREVQRGAAGQQADLNGDGKVDFIDFTIFSSVYGQAFGGLSGGNNGASGQPSTPSGPGPITPNPDAQVPITSSPSGGDVTVNQ